MRLLKPLALVLALLPGPSLAQTADTALQDLLTVLQDDTARAALIDELQAAQATPTETTVTVTEDGSTALVATKALGLGGEIAAAMRDQLAALQREVGQLFSASYLRNLASALTATELLQLLGTIAATLAVQLGLGAVLAPLRRRRFGTGLGGRIGGTALATGCRLVTLALAWGAGLSTASWLSGQTGNLWLLQTLYLSAFVTFGLGRVVLALIASPEAESGNSLSWAAPALQRGIWRATVLPLGIVVQGFLFLQPGLRALAGLAAVRPTRVLVATLAVAAALWGIAHVVRVQRGLVANPDSLLMRRPELWAWPAALTALYSWVVTITMPDLAAGLVAGAVAGTALALVAAATALRLKALSEAMAARAKLLPPGTHLGRLEGVKIALARIGVLALALLAVAALAAGWGLFDPLAALGDARVQEAIWRVVSALLVLAGAAVFWLVVATLMDRWLVVLFGDAQSHARRRTLLRLFRNAFGVVVVVIAVMVALAQLGLDVAPLLAGAGVVGIAIGFGAQKLVQDIITGVFIQIENALNEGDLVDVAGLSGRVERVSIRSLRLRSAEGVLHIIPFSSVTTVSNRSRQYGAAAAT